jgi:hypothetical protein
MFCLSDFAEPLGGNYGPLTDSFSFIIQPHLDLANFSEQRTQITKSSKETLRFAALDSYLAFVGV